MYVQFMSCIYRDGKQVLNLLAVLVFYKIRILIGILNLNDNHYLQMKTTGLYIVKVAATDMRYFTTMRYKRLCLQVFHLEFLQFPVDLVTFSEEVLNRKLHFLCSES